MLGDACNHMFSWTFELDKYARESALHRSRSTVRNSKEATPVISNIVAYIYENITYVCKYVGKLDIKATVK